MAEPDPIQPQPQPPKPGDQTVFYGLGLTFALHLLQIPLAFILGEVLGSGGGAEAAVIVGLFSLILIGVTQLVYILPAIVIFWARGQRGMVQGLAIGAALTLVLNAACWGAVFSLSAFSS